MPQYKLTYFSLIGLGEPIRMMLSYMGEDFEDHRFLLEDWAKIKPTMPWGKVPVLEIDGKAINQSTAITRYLGKEAGLGGANNWEDLQIDSIVDTLLDFVKAVAEYTYDRDAASKEKKKGPLLNETAPFYLKKFDEHIAKNGGYVANGKLSWGDIYFVAVSQHINWMIGFEMFENYKNIVALQEKILSLPKIKAWVEKRPEIQFKF